MDYPDRHLELLTAEAAMAFKDKRVQMRHNAGVSSIEALEAQLTWWMIKDVFDRYPDLRAFKTHEVDQDADTGAASLASIWVSVFAVGETERMGKPTEPLASAQKELRDILISYGMAILEGLYDLLDTGGCAREDLSHWDWGQFGKGWVERRQELFMKAHMPAARLSVPSRRL